METVSVVPFSRPIAIISLPAKEKPKIKFLKIDGFYTNCSASLIYFFVRGSSTGYLVHFVIVVACLLRNNTFYLGNFVRNGACNALTQYDRKRIEGRKEANGEKNQKR